MRCPTAVRLEIEWASVTSPVGRRSYARPRSVRPQHNSAGVRPYRGHSLSFIVLRVGRPGVRLPRLGPRTHGYTARRRLRRSSEDLSPPFFTIWPMGEPGTHRTCRGPNLRRSTGGLLRRLHRGRQSRPTCRSGPKGRSGGRGAVRSRRIAHRLPVTSIDPNSMSTLSFRSVPLPRRSSRSPIPY